MNKPKFSIIGGNAVKIYNGTTTFTSLSVLGTAHTKEEVKQIIEDNYDEVAGLILVIDLETGQQAEKI